MRIRKISSRNSWKRGRAGWCKGSKEGKGQKLGMDIDRCYGRPAIAEYWGVLRSLRTQNWQLQFGRKVQKQKGMDGYRIVWRAMLVAKYIDCSQLTLKIIDSIINRYKKYFLAKIRIIRIISKIQLKNIIIIRYLNNLTIFLATAAGF